MLTERLTSYIYLKACGNHKVAARLEPGDNNNVNAIITESSETCKGMFGEDIKLHSDQHYLVGEIADRLYAYEQLGYSPEELKKIIEEHDARLRAFFITGRQCGKTQLQADMYKSLANSLYGARDNVCLLIENVIFNDPATIVFWKDGTKTVVKATNEEFDPEKGLAMAISKKALGNKGNYFDVFKKWMKKYKKSQEEVEQALSVEQAWSLASRNLKKLADSLAPKVTKED